MCKVITCPSELLPTIRQNMSSGGVAIYWPDVCYCPVNGGPELKLHELQATCLSQRGGDDIIVWCNCPNWAPPSQAVNTQIASGDHVKGCAFDNCPLGTCHPMCSQVTGDANELWCHCPCHG
jgi:hypothetical protein